MFAAAQNRLYRPPMIFALYGGAWALVGLMRGRLSYAGLAAASFGTAIVCAMLIRHPRNGVPSRPYN
jgi:hypothetical protein